MKVYLDSGILIAAFRGEENISKKIFKILENENNEFYVSDFVWLEVYPKAIYNKNLDEINFYNEIFKNSIIIKFDMNYINDVKNLASKYGLGAMDSFHIFLAIKEKIDLFITTENRNNPIFRVINDNKLKMINIKEYV